MTCQGRKATRFMVALAAVLVLTVPSVQLLGGTMNASAYSDISMELDYPRYAGVSETFVCTLTVAGGPAGDQGGNFSYRAQVVGDDTAGSSVTPETHTSADRVFKFNVTMPSTGP